MCVYDDSHINTFDINNICCWLKKIFQKKQLLILCTHFLQNHYISYLPSASSKNKKKNFCTKMVQATSSNHHIINEFEVNTYHEG